jgi:hypothetical protein
MNYEECVNKVARLAIDSGIDPRNELCAKLAHELFKSEREIEALRYELKRIVDYYSEYADPVLDGAIDLLRCES